MTLHFNPTLCAPSLLLCTALLSACGSKLTGPVKTVVPLYATPTALLDTLPYYSSLQYGVPDINRVTFNPNAQKPVQDLTY
jgi:hypothetical protein